MRRVLCFAFVLVGLLVPKPWVEIDRAHAFDGVVVKCVGFDAFTDIEARVYMHNDGPKPLSVIVRFLGVTGNTIDVVGPTGVPPGNTLPVGRTGTTGQNAILVAKITSSEKSLIVDAERVINIDPFEHRRHITCEKSDAAPDGEPRTAPG